MSCFPNPYTLPTIDFIGGSTQDLVFHCYFYVNKEPFDLSSCTANFSLINFVNKNGTPLVSKQMEIRADRETEGAVRNILAVTLDPFDTVKLGGQYVYQITIKDISGEVDIPNQGIMRIINNINKAFVQ